MSAVKGHTIVMRVPLVLMWLEDSSVPVTMDSLEMVPFVRVRATALFTSLCLLCSMMMACTATIIYRVGLGINSKNLGQWFGDSLTDSNCRSITREMQSILGRA